MSKSPIYFLKVLLAAIVFTASAMALFLWYTQRTPDFGGDFKLNFRGQNWTFSDHAKDLNILYIGYVKCPDVCPMSLSLTAQAFQQLSEKELKDVQLVFLSVDVTHDTADSVAEYASQFLSSFIGLTGTKAQVDFTVNQFGASYIAEENPKSHLGYSISHTDRLFFLNKKGMVVDTLPNPRDSEMILQKIKEHL